MTLSASVDPARTSAMAGLDVPWTSAGRPVDVRGGFCVTEVWPATGPSCREIGTEGTVGKGRTTGEAVPRLGKGGMPAGARPVGAAGILSTGCAGPGTRGLSLIGWAFGESAEASYFLLPG